MLGLQLPFNHIELAFQFLSITQCCNQTYSNFIFQKSLSSHRINEIWYCLEYLDRWAHHFRADGKKIRLNFEILNTRHMNSYARAKDTENTLLDCPHLKGKFVWNSNILLLWGNLDFPCNTYILLSKGQRLGIRLTWVLNLDLLCTNKWWDTST